MSWQTDKATSFEVIVQLVTEALKPPGWVVPTPVPGVSSYGLYSIGGTSINRQKTPGTTTELFSTKAQTVVLGEANYFNERFITIIPFDNLGAGNAVLVDHIYAPPTVTEFGANEIVVVAAPSSPFLNPPFPTSPITEPVRVKYVAESWKNYYLNQGVIPPSD
jgi:hypothetical protein